MLAALAVSGCAETNITEPRRITTSLTLEQFEVELTGGGPLELVARQGAGLAQAIGSHCQPNQGAAEIVISIRRDGTVTDAWIDRPAARECARQIVLAHRFPSSPRSALLSVRATY